MIITIDNMSGIFSIVAGAVSGYLLVSSEYTYGIMMLMVSIQLQQLQTLENLESLLEN